ncbi:MAG: alanine racemase [Flavobacteriales bacterium]
MFEPSVITISRSAFATNLAFIRQRLDGARLCSVVKGNAYGHGISTFVPMAMDAGVDYFAVYSADEAYALLNAVEGAPKVFIMGMTEGDALDWAIEHGVECCIHRTGQLDDALRSAARIGERCRIHVELETGMHRTGFAQSEMPHVIERLKNASGSYVLTGLFTHFAGAESSSNDDRVVDQIAHFRAMRQQFERNGLHPEYGHQACSAAMMNFPGTVDGMARIGIMQYGFWSNQETWFRYSAVNKVQTDPLRRLISWSSRVMTMTQVPAGAPIGYGSSCIAPRELRVAVVPVGYAHGFDRGLSNSGRVLVRGQLAPVMGIVNMNAITVDITDVEGVEHGDEVVMIGHQGDRWISVSSFSELSDQLNYEMLTRLPRDIPRILTD